METTGQDEVIREVRAIREALAAEHGNDVRALFDAAKQREGEGERQVVHLEPRRVGHSVEGSA